MNISSGSGYPASKLSNFAPNKFILDDIECASMEGWLQSTKFKEPEIQVEVCKLIGKSAKFRGKNRKWQRTQTLYWKGVEYPRKSQEYQDLLDKAYKALFDQNEGFRKALKATNNAVLTHSIGKAKESETVLTKQEFCSRLMKLRDSS